MLLTLRNQGFLTVFRPPVHTVQVQDSNKQFRLPAKKGCQTPASWWGADTASKLGTKFSSLPLPAVGVPESRQPAPLTFIVKFKAPAAGTESHLPQQWLVVQTCSLVSLLSPNEFRSLHTQAWQLSLAYSHNTTVSSRVQIQLNTIVPKWNTI